MLGSRIDVAAAARFQGDVNASTLMLLLQSRTTGRTSRPRQPRRR
jgi:hypothetical protein